MGTAYLRERFPLRIFGLAGIAFSGAAGWTSTTRPTPATLAGATALSLLLLLQFRLWDDLEDRAHDSAAHPDRLLVRTPAAPYWQALRCLAAANLVTGLAAGWPTGAEIVLLDIVFYGAYRLARPGVSDNVWRFSILLFKYPAFVLILAPVFGPPRYGRLAIAALAAYATACAYETLHGRSVSEQANPTVDATRTGGTLLSPLHPPPMEPTHDDAIHV